MQGAIIATNPSTPASSTTYGLWLDGLDVIKEPGSRRWGTVAESVELRIAGPGGVSSLSFVITDPAGLVSLADGMTVRLHDKQNDIAMFYGWVDHFEATLLGIGREIQVTAVGAEALLDWCVLDYDVILPVNTFGSDGIQALVAACSNLGELRALQSGGASTQAQPIESLTNIATVAVTITAGTTLREAIAQLVASTAIALPPGAGNTNTNALVTVDPTLGLRVFADTYDLDRGGDVSNVTISTAASPRPTHHSYAIDATAVVRAVRVIGTGAVATVVDGSGKRGRTALLRDSTLTSVAMCLAAGGAYLQDYRTQHRGSITDENAGAYDPGLIIAAKITITDAQLGASGSYRIAGASWRLYGDRRDVTFEYGAQRASSASYLRRLTRDTLN